MLVTVSNPSANPPFTSWAMTMVHITIFEAINSIVKWFEAYHVIGKPKSNNALTVAAAASAAHRVLVALFPTKAAKLPRS